eukprot:Nk52_evm10s240 gene=Nk52_evmTU10s240
MESIYEEVCRERIRLFVSVSDYEQMKAYIDIQEFTEYLTFFRDILRFNVSTILKTIMKKNMELRLRFSRSRKLNFLKAKPNLLNYVFNGQTPFEAFLSLDKLTLTKSVRIAIIQMYLRLIDVNCPLPSGSMVIDLLFDYRTQFKDVFSRMKLKEAKRESLLRMAIEKEIFRIQEFLVQR